MHLLFLHGLEGSPEGAKVQAFRQHFEKHRDSLFENLWVPDQRGKTPSERLEVIRSTYAAIPSSTPPLVVGSSLGGWLGSILAGESLVAGLFLICPAFFVGQRPPLPSDYPRARQFMKEAEELAVRPPVSCPTHMIIASHDEVIDRSGQDRWLDENPHATFEIWEDDHRLSKGVSRLAVAVRDWWESV